MFNVVFRGYFLTSKDKNTVQESQLQANYYVFFPNSKFSFKRDYK